MDLYQFEPSVENHDMRKIFFFFPELCIIIIIYKIGLLQIRWIYIWLYIVKFVMALLILNSLKAFDS